MVRLKLPVAEPEDWEDCTVELLVTVRVVKLAWPAPNGRTLRMATRVRARTE